MIYLQPVTFCDENALAFVKELYIKAFPPEERRDFDTICVLLRSSEPFGMSLLCDTDVPVGFITYWRWSQFTYIEHFAVSPASRGHGYGAAALSLFSTDVVQPIVLEVELPLDEMARRRIAFYERAGFTLCPRRYIQPPYSDRLPPVELRLMSYGGDLDHAFEGVRDRIHREVYGVEPGQYV